jgi:hypothetical protein
MIFYLIIFYLFFAVVVRVVGDWLDNIQQWLMYDQDYLGDWLTLFLVYLIEVILSAWVYAVLLPVIWVFVGVTETGPRIWRNISERIKSLFRS